MNLKELIGQVKYQLQEASDPISKSVLPQELTESLMFKQSKAIL